MLNSFTPYPREKMLMRMAGIFLREQVAREKKRKMHELIPHKFMQIAASDFNDLSTIIIFFSRCTLAALFFYSLRVEFLLLIAFTNLKSIVIFIHSVVLLFSPLHFLFYVQYFFHFFLSSAVYYYCWLFAGSTMDRFAYALVVLND